MVSLQPSRGLLFITPIDDIPPEPKNSESFGPKTKVKEIEVPYKYRVEAVGPPIPWDGIMVDCEAKVGDIITTITKNSSIRETNADDGFLWEGVKYIPIGFKDILGIVNV